MISVILSLLASTTSAKYLDCGKNVDLCGVLTLESGYGKGLYHHKSPSVHGLWPQVNEYGSSQCILPHDNTLPEKVFSCYEDKDDSEDHILEFESHEWKKHGICAGMRNADDFFNQVCDLSRDPLDALNEIEEAGDKHFLKDIAMELMNKGFPVYEIDESEKQILLSACWVKGKWYLSKPEKFNEVCGSS